MHPNPLTRHCPYCKSGVGEPCKTGASKVAKRCHKARSNEKLLMEDFDRFLREAADAGLYQWQQDALEFLQDKVDRGIPASCATKEMTLARRTASGVLDKLKVKGETK